MATMSLRELWSFPSTTELWGSSFSFLPIIANEQGLVARSYEAHSVLVRTIHSDRSDSDSGAVAIRLTASDIRRERDLQRLVGARLTRVPTPNEYGLARRACVRFHKTPNPAPANSVWQ